MVSGGEGDYQRRRWDGRAAIIEAIRRLRIHQVIHLVKPERQRRFALEVVRRLRAAGFEALWAGGCVRDELMGREPKDYDVATNATPEQVQRLFRHTLSVGAAFGVVIVVGPKHAGQIEVATFRSDSPYSDGRHPDHVVYSSAEEDARRRDFTINGLFYDPIGERVIDYVGGQEDLKRHIVRAIGNPRERFLEDRLRMLRAVRFAACLDFSLDEATRAAIVELAPRIVEVSAERISQEMRLMLTSPQRVRACQELHACGLLRAVLPEVAALADAAGDDVPEHRGRPSPWQQTLETLGALSEPHFALALAALLHRVGGEGGDLPASGGEASPRAAARSAVQQAARAAAAVMAVGRRWKLTNRERETAAWLVAHQNDLKGVRARPWSAVQPVLADPRAGDLVALMTAQAAVSALDPADVQFCLEKRALPPDVLNPPPLLTGDDLLQLGVPQGKTIGTLLKRVRQAQLDGEIHGRDDAVALVRKLLAGGV
jgi:poly(A) polymerase